MKKAIVVSVFICLLVGCDSQQPSVTVGIHPIDKQPLKVDIETAQQLPVKIDVNDDNSLPVKIETRKGQPLPVILDLENLGALSVEIKSQPEGLPVEIKVPGNILIFAGVAISVVLIISVLTCFAACSAARAAKAALKSADVSRNALK